MEYHSLRWLPEDETMLQSSIVTADREARIYAALDDLRDMVTASNDHDLLDAGACAIRDLVLAWIDDALAVETVMMRQAQRPA